ncbi:TonB family protein [Pleurocapsales cyanobacterium LEGE 06147]|nr:TonB family protein [Pleurocapsales cyanobacterium LEGE 06147]
MSYDSKLNNRASLLIQPTQIAIIISLALHLLLFKYGLPKLSLENKNSTEDFAVPLVELSPLEQTRLPDLSPEPTWNNMPLPEGVQPFALSPSIPTNPNLFPNLPPVPLPPPPQNFELPPFPPIPPLPSLPSTDIKLPPVGDISSIPAPPPLPPIDSEGAEPTKPSSVSEPPAERSRAAGAAAPPESKKPEAKPPQAAASPQPQPQIPPEQIAAQRQQQLDRGIRNLSASLQEENTGTTDEEARKNYVAWLNKVGTSQPEKLDMSGTYPRDACIRRLEGKTVFGILVNPKGEVTDLELIKSAGYSIFNQQASEDIAARPFKNDTGKPKPYQVTVDFEYDPEICPSLSLPSLRRDAPPKTETSAPQTPDRPSNPAPVAPEPEETETPASNAPSSPEATETAPNSTVEPPPAEPSRESEATETPQIPESKPDKSGVRSQ